MKKLMLTKLSVSVMVVLVFLTLGSTLAHATFQIALQEAGVNAGAITVVATAADFNPTGVSFSGTYGDFTVTVFGASSHNNVTLSDLLESTTSIKNDNLLTGGTHMLKLWVTQTNYSLPAGTPLRVESGLGASINGGTLTLPNIFQAWENNSNAAFDLVGSNTNGQQNCVLTVTTCDTGSAVGSFTRTSAVSLYSVTSVANIELTAGGSANKADHVNLTFTAVPEPTSVLLLGSGLVGLAAMARRRSRKQ